MEHRGCKSKAAFKANPMLETNNLALDSEVDPQNITYV